MNSEDNTSSMWLQNSLHVPADPISSLGGNQQQQNNQNNNSNNEFAAPAPLSQQNTNNNNGGGRRGGRLPSLALCADWNSNENLSQLGQQQLGRPNSARASVAGAHSQQLFALQEQLTLAKVGTDDMKAEVTQLQERLELEQKATKRWKERAEAETEARGQAERKLQDTRYSDNGEMASLREELSNLDQALREERRKSATAKADAIRHLTEQFEQERASQEKWWKESAAEASSRIASLEQAASSASNIKRELEISQRNEADLRGHVESLRTELENAQNAFEVELRQQVVAVKDESTRALLKQEDEFLLRISSIQKEEAARVSHLRAKVEELEEIKFQTEGVRRDLVATQEVLREREAELSLVRRQNAANKAHLETEHQEEMERLSEDHRSQMDSLVAEHSEELAKMKSRVAAASTLNERCARLEKLANEHLTNSQKHEAELQAVLQQLGELQRTNLRVEQERDDWQRRFSQSESQMRTFEQQVEERVEQERVERENKCRHLQQAMDQIADEHREVESEYEANLEAMLARIQTMETNHAQSESNWQKEKLQLRSAESDARRAALDSTDNMESMQNTISMLTSRLEDQNNQLQVYKRERDSAIAQLDDFKGQAADQQRVASKTEVDLAAAKSTVRALETRLEVVRAGSVAASASMAPSSSNGVPSMSQFNNMMSNASTQPFVWGGNNKNMSGGGFQMPTLASLRSSKGDQAQLAPGQVVEIEDNFSSGAQQQQQQQQQQQGRNTTAAAVKSALVSRSNSNSSSASASASASTIDQQKAAAISEMKVNRRYRDDEKATRVVDADRLRVFAFTGFEPSEVQALSKEVEQLGGRVVECKANSVPPRECTHLVSNGLMTVKLLVSLARGAWVVPSSFVHQCTASRGFVDEAANGGIRHENAPFFSTTAIAMSPGFRSSRHSATAQTVVTEGGAPSLVGNNNNNNNDEDENGDDDSSTSLQSLLENSTSWPKLGKQIKSRMLICTNQELNDIQNQNMSVGKFNLDVVTWDTVLKRLYPETLSA